MANCQRASECEVRHLPSKLSEKITCIHEQHISQIAQTWHHRHVCDTINLRAFFLKTNKEVFSKILLLYICTRFFDFPKKWVNGSPVFACYCMLLQVTAWYSKNVEYHAKTGPDFACYWNILQKRDPFLHVIAGYCRSLQWLQDIPKMWNIMQIGRFCMLLEYPAKTGSVSAYYYCRSLQDIAKIWNIMQKRMFFL